MGGAHWGIGYLMISAASRLQVQLAFAGLFIVSAMGISFNAIFATLEAYLTSWTMRAQEATFAGGG